MSSRLKERYILLLLRKINALARSHQLKEIFKFYFRAKTVYSAHSPFIFDFLNTVFDTKKTYYDFQIIESIREHCLADKSKIELTDLGAGSILKSSQTRTIQEIATTSLSSKWQSRILFNLVQRYRPSQILELGTSLGITSLYLCMGRKDAQLTTIEGDPAVAKIAQQNFKRAHAKNIDLKIGEFSEVLNSGLLGRKFDMIFIDGNHTEKATLQYHKMLSSCLTENGILIYDDIFWSTGMTKAWDSIKNDARFSISLDLYYFGILFKNPNIPSKKNVSLIPSKFKPWSKGIFG